MLSLSIGSGCTVRTWKVTKVLKFELKTLKEIHVKKLPTLNGPLGMAGLAV